MGVRLGMAGLRQILQPRYTDGGVMASDRWVTVVLHSSLLLQLITAI